VAACCALLLVQAAVAADETRWRLVKSDDVAMLVLTDTDEATDSIGSPYFRCNWGSGLITVESNMQDTGVRREIANLIVNDGYPTVELVPGPQRSSIERIRSADNGGWGFNFQIDPDAAAFSSFGKTGFFQFKVGRAAVKAGIKAGLDSIAGFQAACRRPANPKVLDGSKAKK
jgi:hypothetical protein